MSTRKCTDCNTNNDPSARRCSVCGQPLAASRVRKNLGSSPR